jgi:hypothetical protein
LKVFFAEAGNRSAGFVGDHNIFDYGAGVDGELGRRFLRRNCLREQCTGWRGDEGKAEQE